MAALISSCAVVLSGCARSTPPISAPIVGWIGRMVMVLVRDALPGRTSGPASAVIGSS
jgi:hypothetical protein